MNKLSYILWLIKEIAKSSLAVTKLIWSGDLKLSPSVAWIPTKQTTDFYRVIYANSITLTPGTITVCPENKRLLVHSLEGSSLKDLEKGEMDRRIDFLHK